MTVLTEQDVAVLNEQTNIESNGECKTWNDWWIIQTQPFANEAREQIERFVIKARLAEADRWKKEIEGRKVDILGNCAYTGGVPKTWIKNELPKLQARNKTLDDLLSWAKEQNEIRLGGK